MQMSFYRATYRQQRVAVSSQRHVHVRPSVRPHVRLSIMRQYCVKMKKASVMISSPLVATRF